MLKEKIYDFLVVYGTVVVCMLIGVGIYFLFMAHLEQKHTKYIHKTDTVYIYKTVPVEIKGDTVIRKIEYKEVKDRN